MQVSIEQAALADKPILRNLRELYEYDDSEISGRDVDDHGLCGYKYLDHYWTEEGRHPFLVRADGQIAGLALVNRHTFAGDGAQGMAEFFIRRNYRRQGIGEEAARQAFDRLPGRWQVAQTHYNTAAEAFWRKVIDRYAAGRFTQLVLDDDRWGGPVLLFESCREPGES